MEIERDDLSSYDQERTFLGQLITNTEILKKVYPVLDPEVMSNEYIVQQGKAMSVDSKQKRQRPIQDMPLLDVRFN